jgi:hypothetical protein
VELTGDWCTAYHPSLSMHLERQRGVSLSLWVYIVMIDTPFYPYQLLRKTNQTASMHSCDFFRLSHLH